MKYSIHSENNKFDKQIMHVWENRKYHHVIEIRLGKTGLLNLIEGSKIEANKWN